MYRLTIICLLFFSSLLSFGEELALVRRFTRDQQFEALKKAGFVQIDQTNYYTKNSYTVLVGDDGSLRLYVDNLYKLKPEERKKLLSSIKAIRIGKVGYNLIRFEILDAESGNVFLVHDGGAVEKSEERALGRADNEDVLNEMLGLAKMSLFEQMQVNYMKPVFGSQELFTADSKKIENESQLLIWLEGKNRVRNIAFPADEYGEVSKLLQSASTQVESQEGEQLTLSNRAIRFSITTGKLYIDYDRPAELKIPIEQVDPIEFGITVGEPQQEPGTNFKYGGVNSETDILGLSTFRNTKIADLEKKLRPGAIATSGFLGPRENFLALLASDNELVLKRLKVTHLKLATHLAILMFHPPLGKSWDRKYYGREFDVEAPGAFMGSQPSPFGDPSVGGADWVITNKSNGHSIAVPQLLVPFTLNHGLVWYGFYEGYGTYFRLDPRDIVQVLDFMIQDDDQTRATLESEGPGNLRDVLEEIYELKPNRNVVYSNISDDALGSYQLEHNTVNRLRRLSVDELSGLFETISASVDSVRKIQKSPELKITRPAALEASLPIYELAARKLKGKPEVSVLKHKLQALLREIAAGDHHDPGEVQRLTKLIESIPGK